MKVRSLAKDEQTFQRHEHFAPTPTLRQLEACLIKEDLNRKGGKPSKLSRLSFTG